ILVLASCGHSQARAPSAESLSEQISQNDPALRTAIDGWVAGGGPPATVPPREVVDRAELLESEVTFPAAHPNRIGQTTSLRPGPVAQEYGQLIRAKRDLLILSKGGGKRKLKVGPPPPLSDLVGFYHEANATYGVAWNYLAAIHAVET